MRLRRFFHALCVLLAIAGLFWGPASNARGDDGGPQSRRFEMLVLFDGGDTSHRSGFRTGGILHFEPAGPTFGYRLRAHGLHPLERYTLIYLPAPLPGQGLFCLGSARSNRAGALSLDGSPDLNSDLPAPFDENYPAGARMALALSADVDCAGGRMLDWRPERYLLGRRLIAYHDTDQVLDHTGTYCLITRRTDAVSSFQMQLVQAGTLLTATVEGITVTGSLSGQTAVLTGTIPDGPVTLTITFSSDGTSFSGSLSIGTTGGEERSVSGTKGECWDYVFPTGDPVCGLPVPDTGLVVGGQQFNSVSDGITHKGLDFGFASPLPTIVAPCDGVVVEINRHAIVHDNIIVDVVIRYNDGWTTFVAFEPYSPDPVIADEQGREIDVTINQVVRRGDVLGRLVVPDPITVFPHVHWGVVRSDAERTPVCPRDYATAEARAALDELYTRLGLMPVCLP